MTSIADLLSKMGMIAPQQGPKCSVTRELGKTRDGRRVERVCKTCVEPKRKKLNIQIIEETTRKPSKRKTTKKKPAKKKSAKKKPAKKKPAKKKTTKKKTTKKKTTKKKK